ncbi:MAG TPA: phenylalanine--tRNA ligase subunit alpha [Candidatus Eisenbacteria bacterium]|nr:phenylalanine--tRNA ligase subunit alpha [Candidatus Eisenbacteria bacterium]
MPFDFLYSWALAASALCPVIYLLPMAENSHERTLAALGIKRPEQVAPLFAQLLMQATADLQGTNSAETFEKFRIHWLGRKSGVLTLATDNWLKPATLELKRAVGQELNKFKAQLDAQMEARRAAIESGAQETVAAKDRVDLSLPGVVRPIGSRHLIRQVFQEIEDIFVSIGFSVVEGPEIETPYYNFEALNIPEFHPVRDDMDTFYVEAATEFGAKTPPGSLLLRTHTSPVQIRTMEKQKPPVRVIVPGKVYRRDNPDATHSFMFHQIEGLAVDADITFCDFTGTIEYFVKQYFGPTVKTRFRPSYFPFTEPSVEFDVSCIFCGGSGTGANGATCGKCKGAGWIELFGAGMVDPAVYGFVNYDARKLSGFAFGMGMDRLAMLKYGIDDIQAFFQNDVRFLKQFP